MLFRPLLVLALSILAADALHTSTPPALKLTGAMALPGRGASERLKQTPALRALRGGSDDTMAVNFLWFSFSTVVFNAMVRLPKPVYCTAVVTAANEVIMNARTLALTLYSHLHHPLTPLDSTSRTVSSDGFPCVDS